MRSIIKVAAVVVMVVLPICELVRRTICFGKPSVQIILSEDLPS